MIVQPVYCGMGRFWLQPRKSVSQGKNMILDFLKMRFNIVFKRHKLHLIS